MNNKIDGLLLEQVEFILKSRQPLLATARLAAAASWLRNLTWSREAPAFPDNNQPMAEDLPSELFLGGSASTSRRAGNDSSDASANEDDDGGF